jgi:purine-cytosine permease-like protein
MLSAGVGVALISVLVAALLCHFGFYLLLARFGQKTGLPLYIVGSSTFGAVGGFLLPGFFMGLLQFGWVAVNTYGSTMAMNTVFNFSGVPLYLVMCVWAVAAVVCALKGIQYVAKFSTYLPLIELSQPVVLLLAGAKPLFYLMGMQGITKNRGQWQKGPHDLPTMTTFHPSYILRGAGEEVERLFQEDIRSAYKRATTGTA